MTKMYERSKKRITSKAVASLRNCKIKIKFRQTDNQIPGAR